MCEFFRAKIVNITLALRTTKFLDKEFEYMPWQTATNNLLYFFLMFDHSEVYGPMQVCDGILLNSQYLGDECQC